MEGKRIKKQLSAACHYAYVRLALNYYTYYETIFEEGFAGQRLEELSGRFHGILKGFLDGKRDMESLDALREEAIREMERTTAYTDSFQAYEYVLNRLELRFSPQLLDGRDEVVDSEALTADIMNYITGTKDVAVMNERIRTVLSQLPVRLTKQKFFSMVEEALRVYKGGPAEGLKDMRYILGAQAFLYEPKTAEPGYEGLHEILGQLKGADYRSLTAEAYRSLAGRLEEAGHTLLDISGDMQLFAELVNDLYVLCLTRDTSMMDVSEEREIKGLLSDIQALFTAGDKRPIPEEVTEKLTFLEGKQEAYYEQWMRSSVSSDTLEGQKDDPLFEALRKTELLMSGSSFMSLDGHREAEEEVVDEARLDREEKELFEHITEAWREQPRVLVRASMASILSSLPVFFTSLDETQSYIRNSLESCSDEFERKAFDRLIHEIMSMEMM